MSRDHDPLLGLKREELEGFLQLLIASEDGLAKPTSEIIAYLERVAAREQVDPGETAQLAKRTWRALITERLRAVSPTPVRPFGVHLRAKRVAAKCGADQVASALGQDHPSYERLEAGRISPLDLPSVLLVRIIRLFGLSLTEFGKTIRLALERPQTARGYGFARGSKGEFAHDEQSIAADDLRNIARAREEALDKETLGRLETKLAEVNELLTKPVE